MVTRKDREQWGKKNEKIREKIKEIVPAKVRS